MYESLQKKYIVKLKHFYHYKEYAILLAKTPRKFWSILKRKYKPNRNNPPISDNEFIFDNLDKAKKLDEYFLSVYDSNSRMS